MVSHKFSVAGLRILLALATLAAFGPAMRYGFINIDDFEYVVENPQVLPGLTWTGFRWAFTTGYAANWHPVTWLSHMLDLEVFGLWAGGHHLTNVLFHVANTLLLFGLLRALTGAVGRSAFVAAVFALHPLRVESVAWISERKDVLSLFFGLLTLRAYGQYARNRSEPSPLPLQPSPVPARKRQSPGANAGEETSARLASSDLACRNAGKLHYGLALVFFAMGLMSKPMLVTLPFVLLLLDFWPLQRIRISGEATRISFAGPFSLLLREKIPFLALSLITSVITFLVQQKGQAVLPISALPIESRLANAVVSYGRYLGKLFWPVHLALPYPHPGNWPWITTALAGAILLAGCFGAVWWLRRRPYFAVGWFWFLGTLVPVVGLVQVGPQAMADRYTYLPLIGLTMALTWFAAELPQRQSLGRTISCALALVIPLACMAATRVQLGYWRDTETLTRRALAVTTNNYVAHDNLAGALLEQGRIEEARAELIAALTLKPSFKPPLLNLAKIHYEERNFEAAAELLQRILARNPQDGDAHCNLALVRAAQGRMAEALPHYEIALRLQPDRPSVLNNLAWLRATHPAAEYRDGAQAVTLAERACAMTGHTNLALLATLAAAYAEAGRFVEAVAVQQKVCNLATRQADARKIEAFQRRLELYRAGQPYRETP